MKKTRRKLPNLKTKLFGTIVAIVSVIAVMGVGVLASADSFTVSVTNSVNIAFYNLSGTVSVSAEAGADDLAVAGPKLDETTLYSAGTTTYSTISIADTAGQNLKYSGAEFLKTEGGGVTEQTKAGVVAYTFKYTPVTTDETAGSLKVMLNEEAKPSMSGASLVTAYFVSLDGNNWAEIQSKSAVVPAKDNATLYVLAVCQYLNPQGLAAKSDQTAWKFALTMWSSPESVSALTYSNALPELADGVADGIVLGEDFTPAEAEPVRMNVSGLDGSVSVSANSGANDQTETSLEETTIYSNGANNYSSISSSETGSGNLNYTGTDFLNEVTATTENSAVVYDFAYTPEGEAQTVSYRMRNSSPILRAVASENNNVRVVINETARPRVNGATIIIGYFISTDGNLWAEIESGEAVVPVAQDSALYIRAICQYSNPEKKEFIFTKSIWNFELDISAVSTAISSLTYDNELPEVANGLSDGIALGTPKEEFVYEISEDGQYIYFGEYPQTLKASNVTVSTTPDADGYFLGSDGERYYEYTIDIDFDAISEITNSTWDETEWSSMDQLDASTGEEMVNGGTYYFKMEKIRWRILSEVDGTFIIVAETNLQAVAFQTDYEEYDDWYTTANGAPEETYANIYKYSELRRFLNDDFISMAFTSEQESLIKPYDVMSFNFSTGMNIESTTDQVWEVGVALDIEPIIGSEIVEEWLVGLKVSDFSRATGVLTCTEAYLTEVLGLSGEEAKTSTYLNSGAFWDRLTYNESAYGQVYLCGDTVDTPIYNPSIGIIPSLQVYLSDEDDRVLSSDSLIKGSDFARYLLVDENGTVTYTNVVFDYATPENLALVENATKSVSVAEDGSNNIMLYVVGDTAYILSQGTIYANEDSSSMFITTGMYNSAWLGGDTPQYASIVFNNFNTSKVINMTSMFAFCKSLTSLDLSSFDTSNVTNMYEMFGLCTNLTSLDLSSFDTGEVTNMGCMFRSCENLTTLDLSSFDTSNVTSMYEMFCLCKGLTSLDVSSFNTSNVTNMSDMFNGCNKLISLDLSSFNTSNVTSMSWMFNCCYALTNLNLSSFDTTNVTDMERMFYSCNALVTIDISSFNTTNVTDMSYMFSGSSNLVTIYVSNDWTTSAVTSGGYMFEYSYNLVGGNGTVYNDSYLGHPYAVIDTAETPGYLTLKEN